MPKNSGQKTRLLRLLSILQQFTDEDHTLTADQLCAHLARYGIEVERKAVYDDLEALTAFGYDIEKTRGRAGGYRLLSHTFQLSEIKMLIDAVQSAQFVSEKKSRSVIEKLKTLTSQYHAGEMLRHVHIQNRAKSDNESVFYTVDTLHEAIRRGCMVGFYYLDYTPSGQKVRRHGGRLYEVGPVELMVDDGKYYLIALAEEGGNYRHYRVDKMEKVQMFAEKPRYRSEQGLDVARYSLATFGMFGGGQETVVLRAKNRMASILIDRFDKENCHLIPDGKEHFTLAVRIVASAQFFGWLFALEGDVEILSPPQVRKSYQEMLKKALSQADFSAKDA